MGYESGILICMQRSTTLRVMTSTRDVVRDLADQDGVSLDEEIQRLARAERQRRFGAALAAVEASEDDRRWLDGTVVAVGQNLQR
jgi:hypothetical protein